jgi:recombination protein RecT
MGSDLAQRVRDSNTPSNSDGAGVAVQVITLRDQIRQMEDQFALAMPRGAVASQLIRDALTLLRTQKNLDKCDAVTVLGGLMTCAQLGLRPGVLGHAWLLPFWDKNSGEIDERTKKPKGCYKAQLVIGYQGYRELAQRSTQVANVIGRIRYANDHFDIDYGVEDRLVHKPKLDGDRGAAVGYYAIVKYTNGGYAFWYMSKTEVEQHRDQFAMAKYFDKEKRRYIVIGPWRDHFDSMAVKTAFLALAKWMPKATELASAIEADGSVRVDLSPNMDAMLHGERPTPDFVDGEVVDADGASEAAKSHPQHIEKPDPDCELCTEELRAGEAGEA